VTVTDRSASAAVKVAVEPMSAFTAFTDEIDAWWVRGPINFFDAGRAVAMRIEPGVGGRVLEIYDDARNEALELGRITVWEPGAQLTYRSSVDDTEVDVRFDAVEGGTRVSVTQTLLPDGERALYFWPNVLPWLVPWLDQREGGPVRNEIARLSIALYYEDPAAAARWLARVFQLGSRSGIPAEGEDAPWIELHHGDVAILLFGLDGQTVAHSPVTHAPWVYVDDLDAHFAHTESAGATIVSGIEQQGFRAYTAEDLEGRRWTFAQARPTMS
jgi:uncharacterized glyoxalase superfamily protein PhnB